MPRRASRRFLHWPRKARDPRLRADASSLERLVAPVNVAGGEKHVAHETRADTCVRARAGIQVDGARVTAFVRERSLGAAARRSTSWLVCGAGGSVAPGQAADFRIVVREQQSPDGDEI